MSDQIGSIIDAVIEREGSAFTNDPNDSGGPTKFGVTQATLSDHLGRPASVDDVKNLTKSDAWAVLYGRFVKRPHFDVVALASPSLAAELVDTAVNCGAGVATTFLQRCLNALNLNGTKYPDLNVDADCGPRTIAALKTFLAWRGAEGERVLLVALNCLQGERYIDLAEKRPKDEAFVFGWLKNRVAIS